MRIYEGHRPLGPGACRGGWEGEYFEYVLYVRSETEGHPTLEGGASDPADARMPPRLVDVVYPLEWRSS
jgi:hypothetical protein